MTLVYVLTLLVFTGSNDGLIQKAVRSLWDMDRVTRVTPKWSKVVLPYTHNWNLHRSRVQGTGLGPMGTGTCFLPSLSYPALEGKLRQLCLVVGSTALI